MPEKLYLIVWRHPEATDVGFLSFRDIPESSILWKAIREGELICVEDGGLRGEYLKLKYAREHMKLEWKVRKDMWGKKHRMDLVEITDGLKLEHKGGKK